ncbi:DNA sulfur modification protein DndB [uncultured Jatrophihabitans sp.]|uniref:DNA sulfur modification protein DndB n=1 Tax=uncultured Jatrophihabitans sp. TaxID=1610747 RepID=UPI0035CB7B72
MATGPGRRGGLTFPALRGRMGTRDYFVIVLPLSVVPRLLPAPESSNLPPEARAQRQLNARRVPDIARYILSHEDEWLFSSLTASYPEDSATFTPDKDNPDMGMLHLDLDAELLINDGQHRRAAIATALREDPTLGSQQVSVVLFPGETLERNQQMFSDLNRTVQKTSRSLDIMYDHRDPLNQITLAVSERVTLLRGRVEKEAISLSVRSAKLITVSALYDSLQQLLGEVSESTSELALERHEEVAVEYWNRLSSCIPQWSEVANNQLRPAELRMEYVSGHSVFFFAIGTVGRILMSQGGGLDLLERLAEIDYRRVNKEWQGICMLGPDIVTRRQTRYALRQMILFKIGASPEPPEKVL